MMHDMTRNLTLATLLTLADEFVLFKMCIALIDYI